MRVLEALVSASNVAVIIVRPMYRFDPITVCNTSCKLCLLVHQFSFAAHSPTRVVNGDVDGGGGTREDEGHAT